MGLNYRLWAILFVILSYYLGSFPTGVLYARYFHNTDIRSLGSGNSGATNVGRNFGLKAALAVTLIDVVKGFLPVLLAKYIFFVNDPWVIMAVGLACVIGHAYPIWASFKGGKIMATSVGVLIAFSFPIFLVQIVIFLAILYTTSTVSLASLSSFTVATLIIMITVPSPVYKVGFLIMLLFMFYRHRSNVQRLLSGQESRINWGLKNPKKQA